MTIGSQGRARPAAHVFSREFDGELVLLDLKAGEYFGLDAVGARLWGGVCEGKTAAEIAVALVAELDVDLPRLTKDLAALVDELEARGLLEKIAENATKTDAPTGKGTDNGT